VLTGRKLCEGCEGFDRQQPALGRVMRGLGRAAGAGRRLKAQGGGSRRAGGQIAQDLEQPAAQVAHLRPGLERRERRQERLLHEVLSALVVEATGVAEELTPVPLDDQRERTLVAEARESNEPLICLRAHQEIREPWAHAVSDGERRPNFPHERSGWTNI
jgi:hypothetical protein